MRASEEVGVRYMQAWEEKYYEREEGREEGREELLKELAEKKYEKGMTVKEIADLLEEDVDTINRLLGQSNNAEENAE